MAPYVKTSGMLEHRPISGGTYIADMTFVEGCILAPYWHTSGSVLQVSISSRSAAGLSWSLRPLGVELL